MSRDGILHLTAFGAGIIFGIGAALTVHTVAIAGVVMWTYSCWKKFQ